MRGLGRYAIMLPITPRVGLANGAAGNKKVSRLGKAEVHRTSGERVEGDFAEGERTGEGLDIKASNL